MIIGFKGEKSKLKKLYSELGLKEVRAKDLSDILEIVKSNDGKTVIENYNEFMVFSDPTADLVEKRNDVLAAVKKTKNNLFITLGSDDRSLDKLALDIKIATTVKTKNMNEIEDLFYFLNTDIPYNGTLSDDDYVVKLQSDERGNKKSITEIKRLIK